MNAFSRQLAALAVLLAVGCSSLAPLATPPPAYYALEHSPARPDSPPGPPARLTLLINPPHAPAGFDSQRILYRRTALQLEYFAQSEWVDTPARMLAPLLLTSLANSGAFRAVLLAPSGADGELRLDTEILRLEQDFGVQPSRGHVLLRATLIASRSRRVVAWRVFDESSAASTDDPYGGVQAVNRAVGQALDKLTAFCAENANPAAGINLEKAVD